MKSLRTTFDFDDRETVEALCARAQELKRARLERRLEPTLKGQVLAMLFEKHSTRTRVSFEAGMALLGGTAVVMQSRDTQLERGEERRDSARVMGGYVDVIMMRTYSQQSIEDFARHANVPVINGLTDDDHPCQILTDLFTVYERRENPFNLTWAYVGDGNNMAQGYIAAAALLGFPLRLACPATHAPDPQWVKRAEAMGAKITLSSDAAEAVKGADVICTDVWTSMGDENESEKRRSIFSAYQVNHALLQGAADDYLVLHCLPAHRGEEITDDVLEGRHSVVFQQAKNRLPVQQSILEWLLAASSPKVPAFGDCP